MNFFFFKVPLHWNLCSLIFSICGTFTPHARLFLVLDRVCICSFTSYASLHSCHSARWLTYKLPKYGDTHETVSEEFRVSEEGMGPFVFHTIHLKCQITKDSYISSNKSLHNWFFLLFLLLCFFLSIHSSSSFFFLPQGSDNLLLFLRGLI